MGRLLDAAYAIEYGADTTDQSALNLIYLLAYNNPKRLSIYGESDERYRIAGGADLLPRAIAEYLGLERVVKLGWRLEAPAQSSDGSYLLSFDGRREIRADHVILAFPFAVLRYLDYSWAGFDPLKIKAIQELGAGKNGKMHLQFTNRYWNQRGDWGLSNGSSYADTGYQCTWDASRGQRGASGLLVNYTGGSVAASMRLKHPYGDSLNNSRVLADAANFLMQIEPVFPGISAAWNGKADGSMAHLNPLWNSSYAYWRVGQCHTIAGYEGMRQGNVFFAGEHTSVDFQGWMEGAASSRVRAAKEVLASLKKPAYAAWPATLPEYRILLLVVVTSFVLISLDSHEVSSPFARCSVCQVKNSLGGSAEKNFLIDLSVPGQVWRVTPLVTVTRLIEHERPLSCVRVTPTKGLERAPPV